MNDSWLAQVIAQLADASAVAVLTILSAKGSTPREAGAFMLVTNQSQSGSIGGGALEFEATKWAKERVAEHLSDEVAEIRGKTGFSRHSRDFALGPDLGQCCGGHVTLLCEIYDQTSHCDLTALSHLAPVQLLHDLASQDLPVPYDGTKAGFYYNAKTAQLVTTHDRRKQKLYLYGAGHVGRALIDVTSGLDLERVWVDTSQSRFPEIVPDDVTIVPASDMAVIAHHAPPSTIHIVMSYAHQIDEAICYALLAKGDFAKLGLIGSKTKKARFASRFRTAGIDERQIDRLICPIGLHTITGKSPAHVALSIAGQLAVWLEESVTSPA